MIELNEDQKLGLQTLRIEILSKTCGIFCDAIFESENKSEKSEGISGSIDEGMKEIRHGGGNHVD